MAIKPIQKFDLKTLGDKPIALWIIFMVIFFFGVAVLQNVFDNAASLELSTLNNSENILADNGTGTILAQTPSSLAATSKNRTWLNFDGINDWVNLSNNSFINTTNINYTYSAWFNASSGLDTDTINYRQILAYDNNPIIGFNNDTGFLAFYLFNTTVQLEVNNSVLLNDSEWHNVIGTKNYNGTTTNLSIWIDGELAETEDHVANFLSEQLNSIVKGISNLSANIDEIRIYNRTLTPTEIIAVNSSGRS
ncbi:hypothetical protein LCGC14_1340200, partial [marine sediment metagenome]